MVERCSTFLVDLDLANHGKLTDPLSFLAAAKNSLTTVYDVSRSSDGPGPVHCWSNPYSIPTRKNPFCPLNRRVGIHALSKQGDSESICLFELSERGALFMSELSSKDISNLDDTEIEQSAPVTIEFDSALESLKQQSKSTEDYEDPLEYDNLVLERTKAVYEGSFLCCQG